MPDTNTPWDDLLNSATEQAQALQKLSQDVAYSLEEWVAASYESLTNNGRLPRPDLSSLSNVLSGHKPAIFSEPPPPPPTAFEIFVARCQRHPYITALVATSCLSLTGYIGYTAYCGNLSMKRLRKLARNRRTQRPVKGKEGTRAEAVLVLGAEKGSLGWHIAMHLASQGFVVLATVADPVKARQLEFAGKGYVKALILDPTDQSSTRPFLQSLSTALSLRFPLQSAGDPFQRALSLTAVINALSVSAHCSPSQSSSNLVEMMPLEAIAPSAFAEIVQGTLLTTLNVLQGVLPLLRNADTLLSSASAKPTILTLLPTTTGTIALPFLGAQSVADAGLETMMSSLRREITISRVSTSAPDIRICNLDVGFFASGDSKKTTPGQAEVASEMPDLPSHIWPIYFPALYRRVTSIDGRFSGSGSSATSRTSTDMDVLNQKVFKIITGGGGRRSRTGAGSFIYRFCARLPASFIDNFFRIQEYIAFSTERSQGMPPYPQSAPSATPRKRRPLPVPPVESSAHSSSSEGPLDQSFVEVKAVDSGNED